MTHEPTATLFRSLPVVRGVTLVTRRHRSLAEHGDHRMTDLKGKTSWPWTGSTGSI